MKSFEEEFPSLKGLVDWRNCVSYGQDIILNSEEEQKKGFYYDVDESYATVDIGDIQKHCLDKQRVKEAIVKSTLHKVNAYNNADYEGFIDPEILLKELGLE